MIRLKSLAQINLAAHYSVTFVSKQKRFIKQQQMTDSASSSLSLN